MLQVWTYWSKRSGGLSCSRATPPSQNYSHCFPHSHDGAALLQVWTYWSKRSGGRSCSRAGCMTTTALQCTLATCPCGRGGSWGCTGTTDQTHTWTPQTQKLPLRCRLSVFLLPLVQSTLTDISQPAHACLTVAALHMHVRCVFLKSCNQATLDMKHKRKLGNQASRKPQSSSATKSMSWGS